MAADGSFPLELKRTKPYGYSIFNLDAMTTICQLLSTPGNDLWHYQTPDGRSIEKGIAFLYPYIANKNKWPYRADTMHWKDWPVAQPFLVFGANSFNRRDWFQTWQRLDHEPADQEVIRNLPVRHPLIWLDHTPAHQHASAAAIIAAGLYELSTYSQQGTYYRATADTILVALTDHYRAAPGTNKGFPLLHSTGSKPAHSEIDTPLNYADYYYLQALLRSRPGGLF